MFPIDTARLKNVIGIAAEKAGWGKPLPKGQGLGIAAHVAWQTCVATVVHAEVMDDGTITVPRTVTALDCGFFVNPERIRSQIEGAAVMGMSHGLWSGITFKDGAGQGPIAKFVPAEAQAELARTQFARM